MNLIRKYVKQNKFGFHGVVMASEDTKILEFNQYQKYDKISSIIYTGLESLIKRLDGYKNNFEKLSTTKPAEHLMV